MKSHAKNSIFLSLLLLVVLVSCQKEPCYSCDDGVDSWAKENITKISLMTRSDILKLNLEKQKAAYRTLQSDKKKKLWSDKLVDVKKMAKSDEELQHLIVLEKFAENYDFESDLPTELETFLFEWFDEGKKKFGWTDYFRISGFMMLGKAVNSEKEFKDLYSKEILSFNTGPKEDNSISLKQLLAINVANAENWCDSKWCYDCQIIGGYCVNSCTTTQSGCGWLWVSPCTKNCK